VPDGEARLSGARRRVEARTGAEFDARMISAPLPSLELLSRRVTSLAVTTTMAMVASVIAVPNPITKVAAMPAQNNPCANTRTSECCGRAR
jgi:hypothetical protein